MTRGPRFKNRPKVSGTDSPAVLAERIKSMGSDPIRKARIRICIEQIFRILHNCKSLDDALDGGDHSLKMKLRHLHNELELHVHRHCAGAIYRSEGVVNLAAEDKLDSDLIRCEHTIPAHVIAGIVFNNLSSAPIEMLADFLLTQTIVTAIKREEDRNLLSTRRQFDGRWSKWKDTHPDYNHGSIPLDPNAAETELGGRPFRRYEQTGIKIFRWLGEGPQEIDLANYTLREHRDLVRQYDLFCWEMYFGPIKEAA
jgi:hypothetical protein